MKETITRLASSIIDLAAEIGTVAENAEGDSIFAAETVILLRDSKRLMNQAHDALRHTMANSTQDGKTSQRFVE